MSKQTKRVWTDHIEETLIAFLLGAMVLITFANVVMRKSVDLGLVEPSRGNILWALEATVFLFGWLVLLGASYAVKKHSHLGVDVLVNAVSAPTRRVLALISVAICIAFSALLLKGAWDYWANFANLPATTGRWFPTGLQEMKASNFRGWYETNDIPHPSFLKWMEDAFNEGESYTKLPRMIPYAVLPLSMALLLFRFCQVAAQIWRGDVDRLVASHEVEDDLAELEEART